MGERRRGAFCSASDLRASCWVLRAPAARRSVAAGGSSSGSQSTTAVSPLAAVDSVMAVTARCGTPMSLAKDSTGLELVAEAP